MQPNEEACTVLMVRVGTSDATIDYADKYFNAVFEREWFQDPLVREMVRVVDQSEVLDGGVIESPFLGRISPRELSNGVKTLILMRFKPEQEYYATSCGDNCGPWMLRVGERQDVHIALTRVMRFRQPEEATKPGLNLLCVNNGQVCDTMRDFVLTFLRISHGEKTTAEDDTMRGEKHAL